MDNLITLTATITYPLEQIEKFADNRGYQTVIANPAYESKFDPETTTHTDNGEPQTLPNPQTRTDFVKEWFKTQAVDMFAVDFKRDAEAQAREIAKTIEAQAKEQLAQAINIE